MSVPRGHGLRLLSLDGGGIRGMSTLLILKQIMYLIQQREGLSSMPLPWEYFDLIGGTSTGGIIALMLGRLRMSMDDAIDCYGNLSEVAFKPLRGFGNAKFDHNALEGVIKDAVEKSLKDRNAKIIDNRKDACKTFVCARTALNMNAAHPHLFRTYKSPVEDAYNCEIWEAARATSAAPSFFKQIVIGGIGFPKQTYVDGGLGLNNPVRQVLKEAQTIFPGRSVACVISLGTGQKSTIQIPNPNLRELLFGKYIPIDAAKAAVAIATDCEHTEQQVAAEFEGRNVYFRFNVEQGMQSIALADFEKVQNVAAHSGAYIKEVPQKLQAAVSALCERRGTILTAQPNMNNYPGTVDTET